MNLCISPCLVWCSAGQRPHSDPAKYPCNLASQRYASPAALQVHSSAPIAGICFFETINWTKVVLELQGVKPRSKDSLFFQIKTTEVLELCSMLLTIREGQSTRECL